MMNGTEYPQLFQSACGSSDTVKRAVNLLDRNGCAGPCFQNFPVHTS
jgi:hypothetical protein